MTRRDTSAGSGLIRHSDVRLTTPTDTDASQFDMHGAVEALPDIAPSPVISGHTGSSTVNEGGAEVSPKPGKPRRNRRKPRVETTGVEPATSWLQTKRSPG